MCYLFLYFTAKKKLLLIRPRSFFFFVVFIYLNYLILCLNSALDFFVGLQ